MTKNALNTTYTSKLKIIMLCFTVEAFYIIIEMNKEYALGFYFASTNIAYSRPVYYQL